MFKKPSQSQHEIPSVPFYFMRHGETDWNVQKRITGSSNISLNEQGLRQALGAVKHLQNLGIQQIISSPLLRAGQTADIIKEHLSLPVKIEDGFRECSWGILEGKDKGSVISLDDWMLGKAPEGAETFLACYQRVKNSLVRVLQSHQKVLIVAHGGVFGILLKMLDQKNQDSYNCHPYLFRPEQKSWFVDSLTHQM